MITLERGGKSHRLGLSLHRCIGEVCSQIGCRCNPNLEAQEENLLKDMERESICEKMQRDEQEMQRDEHKFEAHEDGKRLFYEYKCHQCDP